MAPFTAARKLGVVPHILVAVLAGAATAGAQTFATHEQLKQTLSRTPSSDVIQVFVSSSKPVRNPGMAVVQLKGPNGDPIEAPALHVDAPPASPLTAAGDRFIMRIVNVNAFRMPGEYVAVLRLTGTVDKEVAPNKIEQEPVSQVVSLTLVVPKPQIGFARYENSTVRILRTWPTWPASRPGGTITLSIEETTGRADVVDLLVQHEPVFKKGTTEQAGTVQVATGTNGGDGKGVTLQAGRQRDVILTLSGLEEGTSTTAVSFSSPSLDGRQRLPFNVEVSDWWPAPLIVIALGVLLGWKIRNLVDVRRPLEQARYHQQLLAAEISRWLDRALDLSNIQALEDLQEQLRTVDLRLSLEDTAGANTILENVEKGLASFRTAWETRLKDVRDKLWKARARHADLQARVVAGGKPDEIKKLNDADAELNAAERALARDDMTAADRATTSALEKITALESAYPPPPRAAAPGGGPAAVTGLSIRVLQRPEDRVAGRTLTFDVEADPAIGADGFRWEFNDGDKARQTETQIRHRFRVAGAYRVLVTALRGGYELVTEGLSLQIVPGPAERLAAEAAKALRRTNRWLTIVSFFVAALTGMGLLYLGKSFGTPQQYLEAFLWGIGIDSTVRTVAEVAKKF